MAGKMDRRALVGAVLAGRGAAVVVAGLGAPAWDITAAGDTVLNMPLWGGMGGAAMVGLGLALAQPERPVLVITGDGEMLMGLGALATIAVQRPSNLAILVLDNERYGETGMQETATAQGVDLIGVAVAAGFGRTMSMTTTEDAPGLWEALRAGGPVFALAKVSDAPAPLVLPPREGAYLQARLREGLLGPDSFAQR
ncbi:MAG: thiamine pyrophosphate-dependent enzyme [Acetobacteraceae bacterium]|nr:thiamine pyrophosphate-dependent enzyme [Acetobacteraceae bacterium]